MKTCPKDPSIKCSSSCSSCHRFRKGHELVIVDFNSYNYMAEGGPATRYRRFQHA